MAMVAGLALGLWLVLPDLRKNVPEMGAPDDWVLLIATAVLGGLSIVGPPLLLLERRRERRRSSWGPGRLLWFSSGTAAWLLWPPVVYHRAKGGDFGDPMSGVCFAYGTPLMALYVTLALLAGGWLRRGRRRRQARRSWSERFGLLLGLAWACVGGYVLFLFYRNDFLGR